jgi:23S rRNA (cytosine1962-C5)-methyltransferase
VAQGSNPVAPGKKSAGKRPDAAGARKLRLDGPAAVISRRAADRLRAGHVWVYQSDVEQVMAPTADGTGLVTVMDGRGMPLGTALYSSSSQIALRLVSTGVVASPEAWHGLVEERLRAALALRQGMLDDSSNACRLVFSEADALPGLIVDRYGDLVIVQLLTQGMDRPAVREIVTRVLIEELQPATIVERPDPRIRELEELSAPAAGPLYVRDADGGSPLLATKFKLNGLEFIYDANSGQKTGAFLDQRANYAAAERYAHGDALDVCTYQGGFALHLARVCSRVTGVDASRAALEVAERNLESNRAYLTAEAGREPNVDWVEANAFDLLRDWSMTAVAFDTIVLDPPAFAKSKRAVEGALRGYKELNLRALKMLRPGGVLVTCSCSHHVSLAGFTEIVAAAAGDAQRRLRLVERRGAAADHPVILTIPETEYLKCLICVVE